MCNLGAEGLHDKSKFITTNVCEKTTLTGRLVVQFFALRSDEIYCFLVFVLKCTRCHRL